MFHSLRVKTSDKVEMVDITSRVTEVVKDSAVKQGILLLNVPHTTAAVTINESADANVSRDIISELNKIVPFNDNYKHREGNSAAHIKSSLIGCSQQLIIKDGRLKLGTWQGIFFCEFDGPRSRSLNLEIIGE